MPTGRKRIVDLFEEEGLSKQELRERFLVMHPVDLADYLEDLRAREKAEMFEILDTDQAVKVLQLLPTPSRLHVARWCSRERLAQLLERLPPDEATDIAIHLGRKKQKEALELLRPETRQPIEKLIVYPKNTAGGVMTPRAARAREQQSAGEVLQSLRDNSAETIEDVYVVDDEGKLKGFCRLRDLLRAAPAEPLRTFVRLVEHRARPDTHQEELAKTVERYKLNSMPVVDPEGRLLGVVNLHDILHVVRQESAEDMLKMAGAEAAENPLYDTLASRIRGRIPSIMVALMIELALALVIFHFFHQTMEQLVLLAAFIPVVLASAGGVALQSSTVIVRGIVDGSLAQRHSLAVIIAELQTGFFISVICGLVAGVAGFAFSFTAAAEEPPAIIALSIFVGMLAAITMAGLIGGGMPLLLRKMGRDPATSSGPLITAFNDLFGATVYLLIASIIQS
ncbi:MAG TPA: magnesium transporter [Planctomycetota bacterium]|nr:magnesium transporter [Planctomycetota bacterium]